MLRPRGTTTRTTSSTTLQVTELQNGAQYQVRVRARNRAPEPGQWSGWSVEIPAGVPAAPVVTAERRSQGWFEQASISVSWVVPSDNGDPVAEYEVQVEGGAACTSTGPTSCTIAPAERGRSYAVSVRARKKAGWSAYGSATGETFSAPTAPRDVRLEAGPPADWGQATATLRWTAPEQTGGAGITVRAYRVTGPGVDQTVTGTSWQLTGLGAGTIGPFTVVADSSRGPPGAPPPSPTRALPTPPNEPPVTFGSGQPARTLQLVIGAPSSDGGRPVLRYQYQVRGRGQPAPVTVAQAGPVVLTDVDPGTYQVSVRAENELGWGPWSAEVPAEVVANEPEP